MQNAYEAVTARLIAQLETGVIPWRQPWKNSAKGAYLPTNYVNGKSYRGINILLLLCAGYSTPHWMTYKQAQSIGAQVRKGSQGTPIVFWSFNEDEESGRKSAWMKGYTVFNVAQIDGLPQELPFDVPAFNPVEDAQRIADGYLGTSDAPRLRHGGSSACYMPSEDAVYMPHAGTFVSPETYYSTLFHELGHSTGAPHRLDRRANGKFGSPAYALEELVAEFTAAFLSAEAGIVSTDLDAHNASYIAGWLKTLKSDSRIAITAAQRAQKAADLIMGRTFAAASEMEVAA